MDPLTRRNQLMDAWVSSRPIKAQLRRLSLIRDVARWLHYHRTAGSITPPPDVPITITLPDGSTTMEFLSEHYVHLPPPYEAPQQLLQYNPLMMSEL